MDYLRTSGHADGSRERKSTGNIRKWNYLITIFLWTLWFRGRGYKQEDHGFTMKDVRDSRHRESNLFD